MNKLQPEHIHIDDELNEMQVTLEPSMWIILCKNQLCSVRRFNKYKAALVRYNPIVFRIKGHAINAANKLNKKFDCNDFRALEIKAS